MYKTLKNGKNFVDAILGEIQHSDIYRNTGAKRRAADRKKQMIKAKEDRAILAQRPRQIADPKSFFDKAKVGLEVREKCDGGKVLEGVITSINSTGCTVVGVNKIWRVFRDGSIIPFMSI